MISKEFLQQSHLFNGLDDEYIAQIAVLFEESSWKEGEEIIREGEEGKGLYIITDGVVMITTKLGGEMATLKGVTTVGEVSLVDDRPTTASVIARTDVRAAALRKGEFMAFLEKDTRVGYIVMRNIARLLCTRFRRTQA
ncbi:MAG: cyclic nucleotide-binding domain-containing protein, partial [Candidatus Latescibacteria bacterium]|nr:cyclic nucleotide-binding domain-containing protein [Candidatus Latescibacterota bacterium]